MLLALAITLTLLDTEIAVPRGHWRGYEVRVANANTIIECAFEVRRGSKVQALLLTPGEYDRLHRGRTVRPLAETGFAHVGRLRFGAVQPGDYVLLVDNRVDIEQEAKVALRVTLGADTDVPFQTAPERTRWAVVALSALFLAAVAGYSVREFLK